MGVYSTLIVNERNFHKIYTSSVIPSYVFKDGFQTKDLDVCNIYKITTGGELMYKTSWPSAQKTDYFHYCDHDYNDNFNFYTLVFNPEKKAKEWWSFDCVVKNGRVKQIILIEAPFDYVKKHKIDIEAKNGTEIQVEITDEEFLKLAMEAHEKDITLNQHINNILKEFIDKYYNGE